MTFAALIAGVDRAAMQHLGGVEVVYRPEIGDDVTVQGIFDANYVLVQQGETGTEITGPAVFLRMEDLPRDPVEDEPLLKIGDQQFTVRAREKDSLGGIRLLLVRVED